MKLRTDLARRLGGLLLWGLTAAVFFAAADPYLWSDPLHRLAQSVVFHQDYAQGALVKEASEPFWKPLLWLVRSIAWPSGVFVVRLDTLIGLLGLAGLVHLWRSQRVSRLAHHRGGLFVGVAYQMAAVYEDGLRAALFGRGCGVPRACVGAADAVDGPAPSEGWRALKFRRVMRVFRILSIARCRRRFDAAHCFVACHEPGLPGCNGVLGRPCAGHNFGRVYGDAAPDVRHVQRWRHSACRACQGAAPAGMGVLK